MTASRPFVAAACAALLLALAPAARAADAPGPVVPYRPSVSTPADLPVPGYLELEMGGLQTRGPGAGERRFSVPTTFKLAFNRDWGVFVATDAWVRASDGAGTTLSGSGDTTLVLKRRLGINDTSAFGLEFGAKLPTAAHALGSGQADLDLNAIYSADFAGDLHTDINLNETRQGAPAGQPVAWSTGWAGALARAINDDWGVVGELSGTHVPGTKATGLFLLAGSYNASRDASFDFGLAHGLNDATPHTALFVGMTVRLARVF